MFKVQSLENEDKLWKNTGLNTKSTYKSQMGQDQVSEGVSWASPVIMLHPS